MSRKVEISTNERKFVIESLKQGLRIDNNSPGSRKLDEIRIPSIRLSKTEYGYIELDWGQTKLAVRVSSKIVQPYEDRPFEGLFTINCEISSMALAKFDNFSKSSQEVLISRLIEKAIKRSNSLDLESLCIIAGEKVWSVIVDINFLNYDGNFIDSGCFGVMLALHHFKKPDISINDQQVIVHDLDERQPVPLSILHIPICISYSFFNRYADLQTNIKGDLNDEIYVIDANSSEESLSDGTLVVTLNKNRELIQISKNGGLPIDANILMELSLKAMGIVETLTQLMKDILAKHEKERYEEMNLKMLEAGADR